MIRCAQCKVEIPNCHTNWGYKLGNNMFFCTYGCMRTKQADMDAKRSETMKRKAAEKAAKKNNQEAVSNMENSNTFAAAEQKPADTAPMPAEMPTEFKAAIDDTVVLMLDKEEVTYLSRIIESRLMEIIPDGYDMDWLIDMVELAKKLRKR